MRIVFEVLEDIVPMESDGSSHKEAILNSVKRFFQRAGDGCILLLFSFVISA